MVAGDQQSVVGRKDCMALKDLDPAAGGMSLNIEPAKGVLGYIQGA